MCTYERCFFLITGGGELWRVGLGKEQGYVRIPGGVIHATLLVLPSITKKYFITRLDLGNEVWRYVMGEIGDIPFF